MLFEETQKNPPIYALGALAPGTLIVFGVFGYGIYQQIGLGKPWGDKPMSDDALIFVPIFLILVMISVYILITHINLKTIINRDGIDFRHWPNSKKWMHISKTEIISWEMVNYKAIREFGGHGAMKRKKKESYTIRGTSGLHLKLHSGRELLIGTQRSEAMRLAMSRLMNPESL
jgi:hypothetical protein